MQFSKEEWDLHGRPGKAHWAAWENSLRTLGDVSGQEISNTDCDSCKGARFRQARQHFDTKNVGMGESGETNARNDQLCIVQQNCTILLYVYRLSRSLFCLLQLANKVIQ